MWALRDHAAWLNRERARRLVGLCQATEASFKRCARIGIHVVRHFVRTSDSMFQARRIRKIEKKRGELRAEEAEVRRRNVV